ncbi:MAG TPA: phosphoribosylglycinamide formyltransferase [bacterium]|jgi:phosphoribosylglycinamide formyltransferase-1|nr:phosphoribosylglycinamide formyltransferase [bacterium]HNT64867.1 phosphoribosylglycinamide formyltransferase [bacterium]HOX84965.1 phosphoribosylglycinamide formyltransferase [bacterium]HPG44169.1 phosphoribosylglycinamide formyltransferase [bacterium]HPM96536.1 phosphoribosylglycinamide formyltransferase [bacterium]
MNEPFKLAVFISGRGSNLQAILDQIDNSELDAQVACVISNRSEAGGLGIAQQHGIKAVHLSPKQFASEQDYEKALLAVLQEADTNLIVLAGYLKMLPQLVIHLYKNRIINIHPALLPSFGGKGMFGIHVHEAVLEYGCKVSGATVHLVDENYDTGVPILQECVPVKCSDTPESLAARVLEVEHRLLPAAIKLFVQDRIVIDNRRIVIKP